MKHVRHAVLPVLAVTTALALSACGSGSSGSSGTGSTTPTMMPGATSTGMGGGMMGTTAPAATSAAAGTPAAGPHNTADIAFADGMIPHHGQAIEMADMILARTSDAKVTALAQQIKAAQGPEIVMMSGWLTGWDVDVPSTASSAHAGMAMNGMMSAADMAKLAAAAPGKADALFLTQMIQHHRGALAMAKTELASGSNPQAKKLAKAIITGQTAEIAMMRKMLAAMS